MPAVTTTIIYIIVIPDLTKAASALAIWPTMGLIVCVVIVCMYCEELLKPKPSPKPASKSETREKDS